MYTDGQLTDHVNRMCLTDTRLFLPGLNLAYTDRSSMAASTEVRVPFVDPHVFRAAFSFRGDRKIKGRTQKVPLRDIAEDWVPRDVVDRPKASFGAPLRAWVTNDLGPLIDDVLLDGRLVSSGSSPAAAAPDGRRPAQRSTGPVQAAVAAAVDGAVVPRGPGRRGRSAVNGSRRPAGCDGGNVA